MSYAIAMTNKKLAHHFSKAEVFSVYDALNNNIAVYKNPALAITGCAGKVRLIELLKEHQCNTIIVRKVGEKTLAKLLNANFNVVQGNTRHSIEELLESARANSGCLTDASQGVSKKTHCCSHS